ncbi:hypothetical protein EDB92DRAFT_1862307 [Lactarius akahatsu]|uniref:Secreted protein n=1 Tax=Lactarius akahatsu TaxID=416441 RepID=A0AAD4LKW3_9AGAM|nr:hypothetical protein EDB92DRAFT_1862307 [Lactarius akahatsu]
MMANFLLPVALVVSRVVLEAAGLRPHQIGAVTFDAFHSNPSLLLVSQASPTRLLTANAKSANVHSLCETPTNR